MKIRGISMFANKQKNLNLYKSVCKRTNHYEVFVLIITLGISRLFDVYISSKRFIHSCKREIWILECQKNVVLIQLP